MQIPQIVPLKNPREFDQEKEHFSLKITNQLLKSLPSLSQNILHLDLSGNLYSEIPAALFKLRLTRLSMRGNLISKVSSSIALLTELQSLDLSLNVIKQLPETIGALTNLSNFNLNQNLIESIPEEICKLGLRYLGISRNCFTRLPRLFGRLLEKLEILDLDWLYLGGISTFSEVKHRITVFPETELNFEQFYGLINNSNSYEYNFDQLLERGSIGVIKHYLPERTLQLRQIFQIYYKQCEQSHILYQVAELLKGQPELLNTLFLLGVRMGDVRLIQYLTQNCEIDFTYTLKQDLLYHGRTIIGKGQPIYQLILRYCLNFQKLLDDISARGFDPTHKFPIGNFLHVATKLKNYEAVVWSLQYCDVDSKEPETKNTSLHILFQYQDSLELVYLLHDYKANPFIVNSFNKIPRYFQYGTLYLSIVKLFLKYEKRYIRRHFADNTLNQNHSIISSQSTALKLKQSPSSPKAPECSIAALSKIMRQRTSSTALISNLIDARNLAVALQQKILVSMILKLVICRIQYGLRYKSQSFQSIVEQINQICIGKFFQKIHDPCGKQYFELFLASNQREVESQYLTLKEPPSEQQKMQLALNLKINLLNTISTTRLDQIYQLAALRNYNKEYLSHSVVNESLINTNFNILEQYESLQTRQQNDSMVMIQNDQTTAVDTPRFMLMHGIHSSDVIYAKFKEYIQQNNTNKESTEFLTYI